MAWSINLHEEVNDWYMGLPAEEVGYIEGVIDLLEAHGPSLGRPLVDHVKKSRHQNMKELRAGTTRIPVCIRPEARGDPSRRRG